MPTPGPGDGRVRHLGLVRTGTITSNGNWWLVEASAGRVIRGGAWNSNARNVRAAYRNGNDPGNRNDNLGFRCGELTAERDRSPENKPASGPLPLAAANLQTAGV
jgi:hypothetical protein